MQLLSDFYSNSFVKVKYWLQNSSFAIFDQFLFSGTNFLLNIFLARWLTIEKYGGFTFMFTIYLFFTGFHTALLTEPISILNIKHVLSKTYYKKILILHFIITITVTTIMITALIIAKFILLKDNLIVSQLIIMSVMLPLMLLVWLQRRYCYVIQKPNFALVLSFSYSFLLIATVYLIKTLNIIELNNTTIFFILGMVSLISSVICFFLIYNRTKGDINSPSLVSILSENWGYGKWITVSVFVQWLSGNIYIFLAGTILTLNEVGIYKSLLNLIYPLLQIQTALTMLFLPVLSKTLISNNVSASIKQNFNLFLVFMLGTCFIYITILFFLKEHIFVFLYGNKYLEYSYLLKYFLLISIFITLINSYNLFIKAKKKSYDIFNIYLKTSLVTIIVGPTFVYIFSLNGLIIGLVITTIFQFIFTKHAFKKNYA